MAVEAKRAQPMLPEQLVEMLALAKQSDSVELKLTVPDSDQRSAISALDMDPLDAYSLCSIAVTFRITQTVDGHKGVHGMLPKDLFRPDLRDRLSIVTPRPGHAQ